MSNLQKDKYITYVKSKKNSTNGLIKKQKQIHRQTYGTKMKMCWSLSHVRLFATPWTVACQAPPSMEFSR